MPGCGSDESDNILREIQDIMQRDEKGEIDDTKYLVRLVQLRDELKEEQENFQREQHYQQYKTLISAYEIVITCEDDPTRKQILIGLLEDIHDENK